MAKEKIKPLDEDKYKDKAIRFYDKGDHYELIFMDEFNVPTSGTFSEEKPYTTITDVVYDMREADKTKELHIFVGSYGGAVSCLNMILQQVQEFDYRVGINLGMACSCGFMLLSYCHELYTSPYAKWMYHEMSGMSWGKVTENSRVNEFHKNWWNILLDGSFCKQILTEKEIEDGKLTEVWLTGKQLIDRGVCLPYNQYKERKTIVPDKDSFYLVGDEVYRKEDDGTFRKYVKATSHHKNKCTYLDLITKSDKSKDSKKNSK